MDAILAAFDPQVALLLLCVQHLAAAAAAAAARVVAIPADTQMMVHVMNLHIVMQALILLTVPVLLPQPEHAAADTAISLKQYWWISHESYQGHQPTQRRSN